MDFFIPPGGYLPANVVTTGRLPINGEPQAHSITSANRIGVLLFEGLQTENRNVVLTGVTMAGGSYRIYTPSGALFFTGSIRNNGVDDLPVLPESGTYSVVLIPGANTGNISIRVVTDDVGAIPLDGPKAISLLPGQNAGYTFEGVGGRGYSLVRTAYASVPSGGTAGVAIYAMDGTQVKSCGTFHSGAGNCDFTLPATATYRVRFNPGGTASTNATVVLSPDLMSTAELNSAPMKFLSTLAGQNIRYSFEAVAGQSITFSYHNGVNAQGTLYIYRPDGSVLESLPNTFNGASFRYMDTVATTSGTHTAVVFINGNAVGNMDVNITTDANGTIPVNASMTTSLTYGQNGSYTFEGVGGRGYSLIRTAYVSVPAGDYSGVAIYNLSGTQIKGCGSFASNVGNCDFTLPTSGTYRVRVNPNDPTAVTFTLVLSEDLAGTLTLNAPAMQFAPALPGQNIRYAFDATAGQNIRFGYTNGTSPQGILYIYKPDGTVLAKLPNELNTASSRYLDATIAETGTYSAVVYIYGNWAGTMNVYVATR